MAHTEKKEVSYSSDTSVSTFGWNTSYVASYPIVNNAIVVQKSSPQSFTFYDQASEITIKGEWKPWQLCVGGSGQNVQMECIMQSGNATGGGIDDDLAGSSVVIQVNLKTVAAADPVNDPTAKVGTGAGKSLVINAEPHGVDPAVAVISAKYPSTVSGLLREAMNTILTNYFNANISKFNHVFAVMNINSEADKDDFQWIKPTAFQYAVASPEDASLENSAFGLIAMVDENEIRPSQQIAVDSRALDDLSEGSNSAFVISQSMVAQHLLLNGAISTIQGSKASDFELSTDGLSITNKDNILWGNFESEQGTISPKIGTGNFVLRADDTYILVEIVDATYEPSPGITVHMNLTQKFTYNTVQREDGKYVFLPDTKSLGNPSISSTVSLSKGLQITEIVTGCVAAVAGLACGISSLASECAGVADVAVNEAENTVEIEMSDLGLQELFEENPEEVAQMENNGAEDADNGANNPGNAGQVQQGGVLTSTKFRLITGITGAIAGVTGASIAVAKAVINLQYDDVPAFNDFATNCLGASAWPVTKDYVLKSASFRSSLVLNMALDPEA